MKTAGKGEEDYILEFWNFEISEKKGDDVGRCSEKQHALSADLQKERIKLEQWIVIQHHVIVDCDELLNVRLRYQMW